MKLNELRDRFKVRPPKPVEEPKPEPKPLPWRDVVREAYPAPSRPGGSEPIQVALECRSCGQDAPLPEELRVAIQQQGWPDGTRLAVNESVTFNGTEREFILSFPGPDGHTHRTRLNSKQGLWSDHVVLWIPRCPVMYAEATHEAG